MQDTGSIVVESECTVEGDNAHCILKYVELTNYTLFQLMQLTLIKSGKVE